MQTTVSLIGPARSTHAAEMIEEASWRQWFPYSLLSACSGDVTLAVFFSVEKELL